MTEPTPEAYEAAAVAQALARVPEPSMSAAELTAFVREYLIDDNLHVAVDAVWPIAEATVRAKVAAEIRAACMCTDPDGCAYQVSAEIAEGPNAPTHRPVRRRLTLLHGDDEGGGTSSQGYLTCATCFPLHVPVPIGADPNWPCVAARIAEGKGDET